LFFFFEENKIRRETKGEKERDINGSGSKLDLN
jgi:hypothetical protein